ncbi:GNAT family N-acetyltransferase [Bacillus sp. FJAT-42376]|uniref:GNAT family N-acetyltransferase n=1 Tax=Bacillus sp. FJAT-42376 TaxID=2014076 RepID=UPI000F4F2CC6|nr:GNAT family N-acetyltransferase [Bacillus sp. FJAT-42376]AZB42427.1 GNAT family N-acetyltransferase [Bacillus sp. FJAT-42376]
MSNITIKRASLSDAETLTNIMKATFDAEAKRWLREEEPIIDYNIQPPGYQSIHMTEYSIRELVYYKILADEMIAGGLIMTIAGDLHARIDRIFVSTSLQGRGIGSIALKLAEEAYPQVSSWELETSSRQLNNHYFYEKAGFERAYESEDEFCYEKRKESSNHSKATQNQDLSGTHYESCGMDESDFFKVNLAGSSVSNSNVMNTHFSNCNLSQSRFQNINFRNSLLADLNLSGSRIDHVTMGGVQFKDTSLEENQQPVTFERCDLKGSRFMECNLQEVEIQQSDLEGMRINGISVKELFDVYEKAVKHT